MGPAAGTADGGRLQRLLIAATMQRVARFFIPSIAIFAAGLVLLPLLVTLVMSLTAGLPGSGQYTTANYQTALSDGFGFEAIRNTVLFALGSTSLALLVGVPIAWAIARTDVPYKGTLTLLLGLVLVVPGFVQGIGWAYLLAGQNGLINTFLEGALGLSSAPFDINSLGGMTFVQGLNLVPEAFFLALPMLLALDTSYEEAAYLSGVGRWRTALLVDLPLIVPGLAAAAVYLFTLGAALFEIPIVLGFPNHVFVFSTLIFLLIEAPAQLPQYGLAAAYGTFIMLAGILLLTFYARVLVRGRRYTAIGGKGRRSSTQKMGRVRWLLLAGIVAYLGLAVGLPVVALAYTSLLPYFQFPSAAALGQISLLNYTKLLDFAGFTPLVNTAILVLVVPVAVLFLGLPLSYVVVRYRNRLRLALDQIAFVPLAVPRVVIGFAILYAALLLRSFLPLYGSVALIVVADTIIFLSFATRSINGGLIQIHPELEEAAVLSGANRTRVLRRITVPLLRPTLTFTWFWVLMLAYREVTVAIILAGPGNVLLPTLVWNRWNAGGAGEAAAAGMILVLVPLVAIVLMRGTFARLTTMDTGAAVS